RLVSAPPPAWTGSLSSPQATGMSAAAPLPPVKAPSGAAPGLQGTLTSAAAPATPPATLSGLMDTTPDAGPSGGAGPLAPPAAGYGVASALAGLRGGLVAARAPAVPLAGAPRPAGAAPARRTEAPGFNPQDKLGILVDRLSTAADLLDRPRNAVAGAVESRFAGGSYGEALAAAGRGLSGG